MNKLISYLVIVLSGLILSTTASQAAGILLTSTEVEFPYPEVEPDLGKDGVPEGEPAPQPRRIPTPVPEPAPQPRRIPTPVPEPAPQPRRTPTPGPRAVSF